ncbi:PREDICTED: uncharacterized protein LOC106105223 [Papilio polytes]|uniref:uncharacterized protein LOC106105223 n=1 Tax=Papilio polytes TaxID=76194 RepID=UPI000675CC98|nr:PREDICTED: uncharacterized protein LOC106105223 [Papilio polytes]
MADAAAARREARRKRILENSHNRLQLISGKINDECCKDSLRTPMLDLNVDVPLITEVNSVNTCFVNNGVIPSNLETQEFTSGNADVLNDLTSLLPPTPEHSPSQHSSIIGKLVDNKYDIVLLSLFIQILNGLSIFNVEKSYFFLPLVLYVVTKLFFFPNESNSSIANTLLQLQGISAQNVKVILNVMQLFMVISRDVSVFLFTTICLQSIPIMLLDVIT